MKKRSNNTGPNGQKTVRPFFVQSEWVARANPVTPGDVIEEKAILHDRVVLLEDYVRFFNSGDDLLKTIVSVVHNSPTCASIIQQKVNLAMGDGLLVYKGRAGSIFQALARQQKAVTSDAKLRRLDEMLGSVNLDGHTAMDVMQKALTDYFTFGNAYIMLSRGKKDGPVYARHVPFPTGRLHRKNEEGVVDRMAICADWKNWNATDAKQFAVFPAWSKDDDDGVERSVIHIASYQSGFDYYGVPEWVSALFFATLEYMIGRRNQSRLTNSNIPAGILQIFGAASEQEAEQILKDAKDRFVGIGKNAGLLIQVMSEAGVEAKFTPIENTPMEGELLELAAVCAQEIITAHRWTTALAGVATSGKLGSNQQLIQEFQYVQAVTIKPVQKLFLSAFLNRFLAQNGVEDMYLDIANATPVSFFGDISVDAALSTDEKRAVMGYDAAETEPQQQQQTGADNASNTNANTNTAG